MRYFFKLLPSDDITLLFGLNMADAAPLFEMRWREGAWVDAHPLLVGWLVEGDPYLDEVSAEDAEKAFPGSTTAPEAGDFAGAASSAAGVSAESPPFP